MHAEKYQTVTRDDILDLSILSTVTESRQAASSPLYLHRHVRLGDKSVHLSARLLQLVVVEPAPQAEDSRCSPFNRSLRLTIVAEIECQNVAETQIPMAMRCGDDGPWESSRCGHVQLKAVASMPSQCIKE